MINRLRRNFVLVAMLSLLLVLAVILGTSGLVNYLSLTRRADQTLEMLENGEGGFGQMFPGGPGQGAYPGSPGAPGGSQGTFGEGSEPPEGFPGGSQGFYEDDGSFPGGPGPEGFPGSRPGGEQYRSDDLAGRMNAELPYRSRYFSVALASDGTASSADTDRIAAVTEAEALELGEKAAATGRRKGFEGVYRFRLSADGATLWFLDCSSELSSFRGDLRNGILIALGGLAAVLILLILLSGRIVRPLAESYEKQKRFITNAGHELKTPLAIINADTEVLELDIGGNEFLTDIRRQTGKLSALTADLITLSRMEEENRPRILTVFSLSRMAEEASDPYRAAAMSAGKTLKKEIAEGVDMQGDEAAVAQIFGILLDNAFKYSPENGTVTVRLEDQGRSALITVENDTAEPVTREECDRMFERFYRGDAARSASGGGFGLGLAIASAAVSAHKGKIGAEPVKDGRALAVRVVLPKNL